MALKIRFLVLVVTGVAAVYALAVIGAARRAAGPPVGDSAPGPRVTIEVAYSGASAEVIAGAIAAPLEGNLKDITTLKLLRSRCSDGRYVAAVFFKRDVNGLAAKQRVKAALDMSVPVFPPQATLAGPVVEAAAPDAFVAIHVVSPDGSRDLRWLSNFANGTLKPALHGLRGVETVRGFGLHETVVRVLLNARKLESLKLVPGDALAALETLRRADVSELGAKVSREKKVDRVPDLTGLKRLAVTKTAAGQAVRLEDIARIDIASDVPNGPAFFDDKPAVLLAVYPGFQADFGEFTDDISAKLSDLRKTFPPGVAADIVLDLSSSPDNSPPSQRGFDHIVWRPRLSLDSGVTAAEALRRHCLLLKSAPGVKDVVAFEKDPFDFFVERPCLIARLSRQPGHLITSATMQAVAAHLKAHGESVAPSQLTRWAGNGTCSASVDLAVTAPAPEDARIFADRLVERLRRCKELSDVQENRSCQRVRRLNINIDAKQAAQNQIATTQLFPDLELCFDSLVIDDIRELGPRVKVSVDTGFSRDDPKRLEQLKWWRDAKGTLVSLKDIAKVTEAEAYPVIERLNGRPMVEITAEPGRGASLVEIRALCEKLAKQIGTNARLGPDCKLTWLSDAPPSF